MSGYSGAQINGDATGISITVTPEAMGLDGTSCAGLTAAQCRDRYLRWVVGLDNGTPYQRCAVPGSTDCNLVGDIFHSTPRLVGPPSALLRDETYQLFASTNALRPIVMYTSTNDGFLHAFKVAAVDPTDTFKVDSKQNNELWAFIPPAVLPSLPSQYPGTHQILLDGVPVVSDVVALNGPSGLRFERSPGQASAGQGQWRTVLIQGFGGSRGGYFALDVTDPVAGPTFLWQLTEDEAGAPIFGNSSSTPLITTLFFDAGGGDVKEVAVAVLPGGDAVPTGGPCARRNPTPTGVDPRFSPRGDVPCYGAAVPARSLTIARLDTGEIIRTFRGELADAPAALNTAGRVIHASIDSPITGTPVPFPGTTGAIADRIFVGDRDGTMWRVDVSATNPSNWTMKLFFDAYATTLGHDWRQGHACRDAARLVRGRNRQCHYRLFHGRSGRAHCAGRHGNLCRIFDGKTRSCRTHLHLERQLVHEARRRRTCRGPDVPIQRCTVLLDLQARVTPQRSGLQSGLEPGLGRRLHQTKADRHHPG